MKTLTLLFILFLSMNLPAQSLFENAVSDDEQDKTTVNADTYELNGYIRGDLFVGRNPDLDEAETKSGYAETSLRLRVRKGALGDGFADIRFRKGSEFGESIEELELREAYINTYLGRFDLCIGQQIIVWGRADGFNPTDNISPKNMLVRSPNEDDRRQSSFLFRSFYNLQSFRLEAIWAPFFEPSVLPVDIMDFQPGITFTEPDYPDENLENSAIALKLNIEKPSFDGSLSYFNGSNPNPGMDIGSSTDGGIAVMPRAYRMHVFGADFSTTLSGDYGLRGEFAYRKPHDDCEDNIYIPNPDLQYTLGIDRQMGADFSVIVQYIGRYVFDYTELTVPSPNDSLAMPHYQIVLKNRMIASQQEEISHSISFRPAWTLLHETLDIEILGLYNITTEEFLMRPKTSYDIADDLTVTIGGEIYIGPDDTLYDSIGEQLGGIFIELKTSF